MEQLIGTILTLIIIFYLFRLIFRLFLPFILTRFFKRAMRNSDEYSGFYNASNDEQRRDEGDVKVQSRKKHTDEPSMSEKLGEGDYVDFEEIK